MAGLGLACRCDVHRGAALGAEWPLRETSPQERDEGFRHLGQVGEFDYYAESEILLSQWFPAAPRDTRLQI